MCALLSLAPLGAAQAQDNAPANENRKLRERLERAAMQVEEANRRVAEMELRAVRLAEQIDRLKERLNEPTQPRPADNQRFPPPNRQPGRDGPLRVVLQLNDRSRIVGTPDLKAVPVRTSYAEMQIPIERVQTIAMDDPAKQSSLDLRNGDRLKGVVSVTNFVVTGLFGKLSIARKHVNRLSVVPAGEAITENHAALEGPAEIEKRMKQTIIPEIDFRAANIHDVVNFLQEASVRYGPREAGGQPKGVNAILNIKGADAPLITFTARHISFIEALRIVTQVADLQYRVEGNVVFIEPKRGR